MQIVYEDSWSGYEDSAYLMIMFVSNNRYFFIERCYMGEGPYSNRGFINAEDAISRIHIMITNIEYCSGDLL